jgi:putative aminopeptidase FrvX
VQSGVRPGLEGVRVVDAATITSARMRDVLQQEAPTQQLPCQPCISGCGATQGRSASSHYRDVLLARC